MKTDRLKLAGGQLQTRASFEPASFNADKSTVELVWTTGARGVRFTWDEGRYFEELAVTPEACDLSRLNNGAPLLNAHSQGDLSDVVGVVERAWIENGVGKATVRFSERDDVKPIKADVQAGIIRHISVGYRVNRYEKVEEEDGVPVYRATNWIPMEVSLVPMGFDDAATVRAVEKTQFHEVEVQTRGEPPQEQRKQMDPEIKTPAAQPAVDVDAVRAEAQKSERARVSEIHALVRKANLGGDLAQKFVDDGATVEAARAALFDKLAERSESIKTENHPRIEVGETEKEKRQRAAANWLIVRGGSENVQRAIAKGAKGFKGLDLDPGEYRGMSLFDLARESLEARGVKTRGMDRMQVAGMALAQRSGPGGMATTGDFPVLLETAMYKQLLGSYSIVSDTWKSFCKTDTVPDFRTSNRYRTGSFGVLDSKNEHGEFKNKSIPDGTKFAISTATKGNIIGISREAIVNDDMSALSNLASGLGRAAGLSIEVDVYSLLAQNAGLGPTMTDGLTLFHATHGNISTGSALSVNGLDADRVVMGSQLDPSNNEVLSLRPQTLLVPLGLGGDARVINEAQYDISPSTSKNFQTPNKVRGLFSEIVDTARLTGTRRYLFTDPGEAAAIVVVFLEGGDQAPYLEQQQGFRMDGFEWKVRMDYNVVPFDYRGAVTNAGA